MTDKEYIERGALIEFVKQNTPNIDGDTTMQCVERAMKAAPAADVVSLDDVREAFQAYILEMTCSKYGTPEETQFARDIVKQAVDIVLGERKENP